MDKAELNRDLEDLWNNFLQVRATYPYARPTHVGQNFIQSAPYYRSKGLKLKVTFDNPLTMDDVERLRELGYWINQSVIVRLYTLFEYYGVISERKKIETKLDGHQEVDILRRLRKYFAHTGRYNEQDPEQKKLFDRIVNHFNLVIYDKDRFPIPIDMVIEVIFQRTKKYVEQI
jgi:hypothetical protein